MQLLCIVFHIYITDADIQLTDKMYRLMTVKKVATDEYFSTDLAYPRSSQVMFDTHK